MLLLLVMMLFHHVQPWFFITTPSFPHAPHEYHPLPKQGVRRASFGSSSTRLRCRIPGRCSTHLVASSLVDPGRGKRWSLAGRHQQICEYRCWNILKYLEIDGHIYWKILKYKWKNDKYDWNLLLDMSCSCSLTGQPTIGYLHLWGKPTNKLTAKPSSFLNRRCRVSILNLYDMGFTAGVFTLPSGELDH